MHTSQRAKTHPRKISRDEFDKLFPNRTLLEAYTGELVEWFANEGKNILGAIDHEPRAGTWSYVVMKGNQEGELRVVDLKENIKSRTDAETELFRKMEAAERRQAPE
jgi:hypothetical protein